MDETRKKNKDIAVKQPCQRSPRVHLVSMFLLDKLYSQGKASKLKYRCRKARNLEPNRWGRVAIVNMTRPRTSVWLGVSSVFDNEWVANKTLRTKFLIYN